MRMEQIQKAVSKLKEYGPHIICGDFNALRRADYPVEEWQRFEQFAAERGWDPREERVTTCMEGEHGYLDAFARAGEGEAHTFYLPPARIRLRLDFFYASARFPARFGLRRCWHGPTAASCHRPVLLELTMESGPAR
uniref:Endonuclease/exonuclease/phosphatase domain-containing protein n=1 Tax=Pyramimonas obovata TaxID=1411642 RepID=A0A7S0RSH6_9CHLO|mmetsp:Transcript_5661/g.11545  ORF Transcript_5661/g.11545 Transcript_5661/m.11545 type:complete len:137 (+) Transcript_5661:223-633(+)